MGRTASAIINSFTAGELSEHLEGRTDHEKYYSGCRRLENFIPRPQRSVYKRPGTRFINSAKYSDQPVRLIPFDFNSTASQSYIIEAGDGYMRFYKDGGVILDENGQPYEIVTPYAADDLASINWVQSHDVLYLVSPKAQPRKLTRAGHADWSLSRMEFKLPGYDYEVRNAEGLPASGVAGETVEIPAGKTMETEVVVKCRVNGVDEWYRYIGEGIFDAGPDAPLTLTFSTSPNHDANEIEAVFSGSEVRAKYWKKAASDNCMPEGWTENNWPSCVGLYEDRLVLAATPDRPLAIWLSRTGEYEDFRLNTASYIGGVQEEPLDNDAIEIVLSGSRVNPIRWVMDQQDLLVGTNAGEVKVWSGSAGEGMTPSKVQRKRQSGHGSAAVPAQMVSDVVVFVSRSRRKVREMVFDFGSDKYASPDLTLLADHVTGPGIVEMDYAREPDGILWVVRTDGMLAGCTYLREQRITAWHRHPLGGGATCESVACIPGEHGDEVWLLVKREVGGTVKRFVERLAPQYDPAFSVGSMVREDEALTAFFMDSGLSSGVAVEAISGTGPVTVTAPGHGAVAGDTVRLDRVDGMTGVCGVPFVVLSVSGDSVVLDAPAGTVSGRYAGGGILSRRCTELGGLGHLEGEIVQVVADGCLHPPRVVEAGSISLDRPAFLVHAGFAAPSVLQPMRLELPISGATTQTRTKRLLGVTLRFQNTVGGKVCPGDDVTEKYERILPHVQPARAGAAPSLFSGDREVKLAAGYDRDGLFTIRQDAPMPMTVVCCVPRAQEGA